MPIPGFVDLQINGWGGVDFSADGLTEEDCERAFDEIVATGTIGFLPTVITSSVATYQHVLPILARVARKRPRTVLGLHLEGPFLDPAPGARGSHRADLIREPDTALLDHLIDLAGGTVRVLTVAAGRPGVSDLIASAVAAGIKVALGHQLASLNDLEAAAHAGATMLTHLGNGAPNQVHRHNNPLLAGLSCRSLTATIITDGFHLPKAAVAAVVSIKQRDPGFVVVSDASYLAGLTEGTYHRTNGVVLEVVEGPLGAFVIKNPAQKCLSGSAASMLQCANHLWSLGVLESRDELEAAVFHKPLQLLDLNEDLVDTSARVRWNDEGRFEIMRS